MSDTANQIQALITASGKSAPQMTQAFARLGGGNMQSGITRLANFLTKEGIKIGTIRGAIGGVVGTAAIGSLILLIRKTVKEHKNHKSEGEAILKELEDAIANESENSGDSTGKGEQREESTENTNYNEED
jgi:hypothetical protein